MSNNFNNGLAEMMNIDYQIVVRKNKNGFSLIIPELNLIARGDDIESAYQNLENEKKDLFKKYIEIDAKDQIPLPSERSLKQCPVAQKAFFRKMTITGLFIAILVWALCIGANYTIISLRTHIHQELANFKHIVKGKISLDTVEKLAQRLRETPPERREELLASLRIIINESKPFVDELKLLFNENAEQ
jgi:hypothetical protein